MARLEPIVTTKAGGRGKGRSGNNVVSARSGNGRVRRPARGAEQVAAIRTWARAHGYTVAEKGRIPTEIEDACRPAAGPSTKLQLSRGLSPQPDSWRSRTRCGPYKALLELLLRRPE